MKTKIENRNQFKSRLIKAYGHSQLTREDIARHFNITVQAIAKWFANGVIAKDKLPDLAELLGVEYEWLSIGRGEMLPTNIDSAINGCNNLTKIRLITEEEAAEIGEDLNLLSGKDAIYIDGFKENDNCYAIELNGQSMIDPSASVSFTPGIQVLFNPSKRQPTSGKFVLAKLKESKQVIFRQYVKEGSEEYLNPLNKSFPLIFEPFEIVSTAYNAVHKI